MLKYEIKKVFARRSSKIALVILTVTVGIACWLAAGIYYVNESGEQEYGYAAVQKLRAAQKEWAGVLDEEKIRKVIEENRRIQATPQAQSTTVKDLNIVFGWKQGISEIRNLLNFAYAESFQSYDYYLADRLRPDAADAFYANRIGILRDWLAQEAAEQFTQQEKEYLLRQYETISVPFAYDYMKGWVRACEYAPTVIMICMLILGYLVAGIFAGEFEHKADAVFYSSFYGRDRAVGAKLKAAFFVITLLYWLAIFVYSAAVFSYLGADGANCQVQADFTGWKCFYPILNWQKYLLTVLGGYLGCLFISLLTMLVSAGTRSTVLAVIVPFVLIFLPSFLGNINSQTVNKILGLLPDRLLQVSTALGYFDLYEISGKVVGAVPVLFVLYGIGTLILPPVIYQKYRRLDPHGK